MQQILQRFFLLMGLMGLMSIQACHDPFEQTFSMLGRRCGNLEPGLRSIPLMAAHGTSLDGPFQTRMLATWRAKGSDVWAPLGFSSKGCLLWPEDQQGELVVGNDEQLLYESLMNPEVPYLQLKDKINFNFEFDCSRWTTAGNASLPFPALTTDMPGGFSDLALIKVYVQSQQNLQDSRGAAREILWRSPTPLALAKLPSSLDIRQLAEGSWQLFIEAGLWDPVKGDAGLAKITDPRGCAFRVMRQEPPEVRLLNAQKVISKNVTLYKDEMLPVNVPSGYELLSCVEPLGKNALSCVTTESCRQASSFTKSQWPRADHPGVYQIYLKLLDQAGNQGPTSCTELKVIESKPIIQVQWTNQQWQKPFAILKKTPNRLAAVVELKHEILSPSELENRLECRLEFVSFSGRHRPPRHARCLSGACQGHGMDDWQSCGSHIEIELGQEWLEHDSWNGSWQIHVRVDDGTGLKHEDSTAIWFTQSQFVAKASDELGLINDDWVGLFKTDQHGDVWTATRSGPLTRIRQGQAQTWPIPDQLVDKSVEVIDWIEGDNGRFFTLWQEFSQTSRVYIGTWSPDSAWSILGDQQAEKIACQKLFSLQNRKAACLGSRALALWIDNAWQVLPWTDAIAEQISETLSFDENIRLASVNDKIFVLFKQSVLLWDPKQGWTQNALPSDTSTAFGLLVEPNTENLLLATQEKDAPANIWSWDQGRWVPRGQVPAFLPRGLRFMGQDQNSRLWVGPFRWDAKQKVWENPFGLQHALQTSLGQIDRSGRVWIKSDELSCFYENEVYCFPLEMFELGSNIGDFAGLPWDNFWTLQSPFTNPSLRTRLYSIKPRGFHSWDPNVTESRSSKDAAKLLSLNAAGRPFIWLGKSSVYQLQDAGFVKIEIPRDLPEALENIEAIFVSQQHKIYISDLYMNWVWDEDRWRELSAEASINWERVQEASDGSLWVDQSSDANLLLHIEDAQITGVELPQVCTESFEGYSLLHGEQPWVLCGRKLFVRNQGLWSKLREWDKVPARLLTGDAGSWDKLWLVTEFGLDQAKIEILDATGKTADSRIFLAPNLNIDQLRITGHSEKFVLYDLGRFWQFTGSAIREINIDFQVRDLFPKEFLPAQPIQKAAMDPWGRVWFILYYGGLYRWDPDESQ